MTDALRPYLDAILAAPEEDEPRLALARFLTDRGDARGEHIRLSCELEKLERDDPVRKAMEAQVAKLPTLAFNGGPHADFPLQWGIRRGFIEELSCSGAHFAAHAEPLMREAPIRVYHMTPYFEGHAALLAACPALARLRKLRLHIVQRDDIATILASPHLVGLRELELSLQLDGEVAVAELGLALRHLDGLEVLSTFYGTIDQSACAALAHLAERLDLELLDVRGTHVSAVGLAEIRTILAEDRVLPRPEPRVSFRFGLLDLHQSKLDAEEIRGLIDSGEFRAATKLVLPCSLIGDAGVEHLIRSGAFPSLVELRAPGITNDAALSLAREAVGLDHLEIMDLDDAPSERNGGRGVSDWAALAIARSTRLPAVRRIERGYEHHCYADGAREDTETLPIARDDGRTVESVIWHRIWP